MFRYKSLKNKKTPDLAHKTLTLLPRNRSGQTAETMTWIIATLVIIGILIIFVYLSVLVSKTKVVGISDVQAGLQKDSPVLFEKTLLSNKIMNDKNKELIEGILNKENAP